MSAISPFLRRIGFYYFAVGILAWPAAGAERPSAGEPTRSRSVLPAHEPASTFFHDLLPVAWQSRPRLRFNAITEMTLEGRKRRVPTSDAPIYFYAEHAQFVQVGEVISAGEKPPPGPELEASMRKALAANGYLPIPDDQQRPDILIVFTFGSSGSRGFDGVESTYEIVNRALAGMTSLQGWDDTKKLFRDAVERGRLIAGEKFAADLHEGLNRAIMSYSPNVQLPPEAFIDGYKPEVLEHFVDMVFHTCYFVTATAFDFEGVARKQKIPLWQTRMAIEANGVSMAEIFTPLIMNTASWIGREQGPSWVTQRLDRRGQVNIGEATIVEEAKTTSTDKPSARE